MSEDRPAWILVADDDPVSLQFLITALCELGCQATGVANGSDVRAACKQTLFDLLLLDRCMPDLGGAALLHALRQLGYATTAIATSAELDSATRAELAEAGYADAVTKPISIKRLAALLRVHLPWRRRAFERVEVTSAKTALGRSVPPPALLEDDQALATIGGDRRTLEALRGLFATELETMLPRIATMTGHELGDWLHRLRASCRYCGATRLLDAADMIGLQLKQHGTLSNAELQVLIDAIASTISALSGL